MHTGFNVGLCDVAFTRTCRHVNLPHTAI